MIYIAFKTLQEAYKEGFQSWFSWWSCWVSFPVQWFVVGEMTWPFEKDQNGVRFGKCVPHFAQLWSWKCFSSANNAVIRTENCQLHIICNWFKWSDLKCYIWIARDSAWVGWRWSRESENERSCFNMVMPTRVEWMYLYLTVSISAACPSLCACHQFAIPSFRNLW